MPSISPPLARYYYSRVRPLLLTVARFPFQAGALLSAALEQFDEDASSTQASAPVASARRALAEQLQRALYAPFRKQVAALQRQTLSKFRSKCAAVGRSPSSALSALP